MVSASNRTKRKKNEEETGYFLPRSRIKSNRKSTRKIDVRPQKISRAIKDFSLRPISFVKLARFPSTEWTTTTMLLMSLVVPEHCLINEVVEAQGEGEGRVEGERVITQSVCWKLCEKWYNCLCTVNFNFVGDKRSSRCVQKILWRNKGRDQTPGKLGLLPLEY